MRRRSASRRLRLKRRAAGGDGKRTVRRPEDVLDEFLWRQLASLRFDAKRLREVALQGKLQTRFSPHDPSRSSL